MLESGHERYPTAHDQSATKAQYIRQGLRPLVRLEPQLYCLRDTGNGYYGCVAVIYPFFTWCRETWFQLVASIMDGPTSSKWRTWLLCKSGEMWCQTRCNAWGVWGALAPLRFTHPLLLDKRPFKIIWHAVGKYYHENTHINAWKEYRPSLSCTWNYDSRYVRLRVPIFHFWPCWPLQLLSIWPTKYFRFLNPHLAYQPGGRIGSQ